MATTVLTRKRIKGPRLAGSVKPYGRYRVWSKASGRYVIDQSLSQWTQYGFNTATQDCLHQFMKPSKRKKNSISLQTLKQPNDEGGDFSLFNVYDESVVRGSGTFSVQDALSITLYEGGWLPSEWWTHAGTGDDYYWVGQSGKFSGEFATATSMGPSAWKRFKPNLFLADMGQFVGEIDQAVPMLKTSASIFSRQFLDTFGGSFRHQKMMSREMGSHWLNLQFGWSPFISDLTKFCKKYTDYSARLTQCKRDNGRFVRRGGTVADTMLNPTTVQTAWSPCTAGYPAYVTPNTLPNGLLNSGGVSYAGNKILANQAYTEKYKVWFSAAFRYSVPSFDAPDGAMNTLSNCLRMYGLRITPTLVWQLTPWSWLADWAGNIGDNIDNFTTSWNDNMAAKYAYIMKTLIGELTIQANVVIGGREVSGMMWRRGFVAKTRRHASQFGFSVDMPNFSAYQWGILAALGFSRLHIENKRG